MRPSPPRRLLLAILLAAIPASVLAAAPPAPRSPAAVRVDEGLALLLEATEAGASRGDANAALAAILRESLLASLEAALAEGGLASRRGSATEAARSQGAAWLVESRVELAEGRAIIGITVEETSCGALVAAESFVTAAGPGSLPLMADAAQRVAARLSAWRAWRAGPGEVAGAYGVMLALGAEGIAAPPLESLAAAFLSAGRIRFLVLAPQGVEKPAEAAREASCRLLATLSLSEGGDGGLRIDWRLADIAGLQPPRSGSIPARAPDAATLANGFWTELGLAVDAFLEAPLPPLMVDVRGYPGTLFRDGGHELSVPEGGTLALERSVPGMLAWTAEETGAYPVHGAIRVDGPEPSRIRIPRRLWGLDLGGYELGYPEIRLTRAFGPFAFVRASMTHYEIGDSLADYRAAGSSIGRTLPLQPGLGAGIAAFRRSSDLRPYLAVDLCGRVLYLEGLGLALDPLAPLCVLPAIGLEAGTGARLRIWVELGVAVYPWAQPARLPAALEGRWTKRLVFGSPELLAGRQGWLAELLLPRVGLRLGL